MRIIHVLFLFLILARGAMGFPSDTTGRKPVVIRSNGCAFDILAPKGWVIDVSGGSGAGMDAQLYPERSTFSTSPAVMYIATVSKKLPGCETVAKRSAGDAARSKKDVQNIKVSAGDSLLTKDHKKVFVSLYAYTQFQSVAYVDEDSTIVMIVLKAKDRNRFDNARYSLKELVGSYSTVK